MQVFGYFGTKLNIFLNWAQFSLLNDTLIGWGYERFLNGTKKCYWLYRLEENWSMD